MPSTESGPPLAIPGAAYEPVGRVILGTGEARPEPSAVAGSRYRYTPHRSDSVVDGWSAGPFTVRAASVRGDAHRELGVPRQDDYSVAWDDQHGRLAIAVADGVSASELSHFGAAAACRYGVEFLLHHELEEDHEWRAAIEGCAWAVVEAAQKLEGASGPDPRRAHQICATTLCLALVEPVEGGAVVRSAVVGDTGLGVIRDGRIVMLLGGKAVGDDGIAPVAVTPLPRVPERLDIGEWVLRAGETLLVGSDGLWDPVGDGAGTVAQFLVSAMEPEEVWIGDFLRAVGFYRPTYDDDRTLVSVRTARTA